MDRSERTAIFEPLMLILKSRKGVSAIIATITAGVLVAMGFQEPQVLLILSPIFAYIGGQSLQDANESGTEVNERVVELRDELNYLYGYLKDQFENEEVVKEDAV